jgi:hypothetical protein
MFGNLFREGNTSPPGNPKLSKAFINGLMAKHNMTYNDVKTWIFCGGHANPECENHPDEFTAYENYFRLCFPNKEFPEIKNKCVCDATLLHNCYIRKDTTSTVDDILVIGSCCIKKFIDAGKVRKCEKCNSDHRNRKYNLCNTCKVEQMQIDKDIEKARKKEIAKYNKVECFDIPYEICQDHKQMISYTRWDKDLKIRYCKAMHCCNENAMHRVIEYFKKYIIYDIEDFINKRKTKHVEYKNIEYSRESIAEAKRNGLKFDGILKKWYKQY